MAGQRPALQQAAEHPPRPASVEADTLARRDDRAEGDYFHPFTLTELFSGWTENRAIRNKSAAAVLAQVKALETQVP